MPSRRDFIKTTCGLALATGGTWLATHTHGAVPNPPGLAPLPAGAVASGDLEALAGKLPLIKRSWRPPNYETSLSYFSEEFTPNKAFFVRYHVASILFFFQAEDGIRDGRVTGVQTCALPISRARRRAGPGAAPLPTPASA